MAGRHADQAVRLPVGHQGWSPTVFLHYRCEPDEITRCLPPGLTIDLSEGQAWLSVTPLVMRRVRPAGLPPVPGWSTFPELNVRTYVRGPGDRDGLWFFHLGCPRRLLVWGAPPLGLPYRHREAEVVEQPGEVRFRFDHGHDLTVTPGDPIESPSGLDIFLAGRWNAFSRRFHRLLRFPISHEPWPLHSATATATGGMLNIPRDLGLPVLADQPLIHYSPGVDVRLAAPRPAGW